MTPDNGRTIIRNSDVFREEYTPSNLFDREPQIKELTVCLKPAIGKRKPIHVWLHGKSGAGKTALARYVLSKL